MSSQSTGHPLMSPSRDVSVLYSHQMTHALCPLVAKTLFLPFPAWEVRQRGKWARGTSRTENVVSGILLLLFPKTRVKLPGSQNEAAIKLLAQAPVFSSISVYKYTVVCTSSVCTFSQELARHCLGCQTAQGLYSAPAPKDPKEVQLLCILLIPLPPVMATAGLLSPCVGSQESLLLCYWLWSWLHPLTLVCQGVKCCTANSPGRKEATRLCSITSCDRGAVARTAAQDWASQPGVSGLREGWVFSLAPLDIPALVPGEVLRVKLRCSPEVSVGLSFIALGSQFYCFLPVLGLAAFIAVFCCTCVR